MPSLDKPTFDDIVSILVPEMDTSLKRRAFVNQALYDAPPLTQNIDFEGNARQFTVNLVQVCNHFGQIAPGRLAVVALLTHLYEQVGTDKQAEIDRIVTTLTREHTETPFEFVGTASGEGAHIFISYSRANLPFVQKLTRDLQARNVNIWIDKIGLKAGTPDWENALRGAIQRSDGVVLVASPDSRQSSFVRDELAIAKAAKRKLYPVWAEGDEYSDCIPMGMGYIQFVDMRGDAYERGLDELVAVLAGTKTPDTDDSALGESVTSATDEEPLPVPPDFEPRNPYKGLRAFRADDRRDFFGRDALIAELVEALKFEKEQARFLAVVGASGSGKSSVVMAGLLPALRDGAIDGSETWRYLEPMVPGVHPLENLTVALAEVFPEKSQTAIREDLDNPNTRGLHTLAKQAAKNTKLVMYIDQFEELFTLTADEDERRHFIDLLTTAVTEPDGTLIVILSLRADFYDRPLEYNALGGLVNAQTVPVLPMTLADLYDVIEQPAELDDVRLTFEDGLVTDILFAVRDEIGALPLLQFTLDQLFQKRGGRKLTKAAYENMGGVRGALTQHTEHTYLDLPTDEHRRMARALFLRLIEPGATEQDTTRRRASRSELTLPDAKQTQILQETAAIFIDSRLLVSDEDTVEVAHEALIREWERLKVWLNEARDDLRTQKKVNADAADWVRAGRPDSYGGFYAGTLLIDAHTWADHATPSQDEADFIAASVSADKIRRDKEAATTRRVRNLRRASIVLAVMVALAIGATILAGLTAVTARDESNAAQTAQGEALSLGATAEAGSTRLAADSAYFALQQDRVATLAAGSVVMPPRTATPEPTQYLSTLTAVAALNSWQPVEMTDEFGVVMVMVPTGCFYMGSVTGVDEQPVHQQCFAVPFWIDKYETVNGDYDRIMDRRPTRIFDRHPKVTDWFTARSFCRLRGMRLPSEREWEYAARGPDSLLFPWGNQFDHTSAVYNSTGTSPVLDEDGLPLRPNSASWVGAIDMVGNVSEWTSTVYGEIDMTGFVNDLEPTPTNQVMDLRFLEPSEQLLVFTSLYEYPYSINDGREVDLITSDIDNYTDLVVHVVRGGNFNNLSNALNSSRRAFMSPFTVQDEVGFRCARSLTIEEGDDLSIVISASPTYRPSPTIDPNRPLSELDITATAIAIFNQAIFANSTSTAQAYASQQVMTETATYRSSPMETSTIASTPGTPPTLPTNVTATSNPLIAGTATALAEMFLTLTPVDTPTP
jgi:formylglycine-generating enzyme required for sulfatase activity/energy-coupling factor transporter ATP-binding protein EcfA2